MEKKSASSAKPSKGKRTDTTVVEVEVHSGEKHHLRTVVTKEDPPIPRPTNFPDPLTPHGPLPSEVAGPSKAIHTETTFVEVDPLTGRAHLLGTTVTKEIPSVSPQPSSSSLSSGLSEGASTSRLRDEPGILEVIGIVSSSENSSAENTGGTVKELHAEKADKVSVRSESPLQHWSPPHKISSRPQPEGGDDLNVIERLPTPPPDENRPLRRTPSPQIPRHNCLMEYWLERIMGSLNLQHLCRYVILMLVAAVVLAIASIVLGILLFENPVGYAFMIIFATIAVLTLILLVLILITNCCYKEELQKRSAGRRLVRMRDHLE